MSFLKHDDGNLARYIAEKEGMSENDAKNLIAKYVREIQAKLDTGDTYDMYQFGRFIKKDGEIDFESWNNYQHSLADEDIVPDTEVEEEIHHQEQSPAPEVKSGPPLEIPAEEPAAEQESEITEANDVIADLLDASLPVDPAPSRLDDILNKEEVKEEQKEEIKPEGEPLDAVPEPKDPPLEVISASVEEEPKLDASEIQPSENIYIPEDEAKEIAAKQAREKKEHPQKKVSEKMNQPIVTVAPDPNDKRGEKKKKSTLFWVLMIVIFLLAAGGGTTAFFYKELFGKNVITLKEKENTEKTDEKLEEIEKQVALETEEAANETEKAAAETEQEAKEKQPVQEEPVEKPAKVTVSGDKSYHIIAGGFGVEANAERLAKKYRDEGKNAAVLGKFNELYLVSYEAYATREEADAALKSSGVKGWVFKYPK